MFRFVFRGALFTGMAIGAARAAPTWQEATWPGFEVYSNRPIFEIQALFAEFRLAQRDFEQLWPMPQLASASPARIVIFDKEEDYLAFEPSAGLNSRYRWKFSEQGAWMILDLHKPIPNNAADLIIGHRLREFYANCVLLQMGERVPPWLDWGLGKFIRGMECSEGAVALPGLTTDPTLPVRFGGSADDLQEALRAHRFLTLEELFSVDRMPEFKTIVVKMEGNKLPVFWGYEPSNTFVDEAYEFTHFCLIGNGGKYRRSFIRFAQAASNGPLDEAGFKRCFGEDYAQMLVRLWHYTAPREHQECEIKGGATSNSLEFRPVPDDWDWIGTFHTAWDAIKSTQNPPVPVMDYVRY